MKITPSAFLLCLLAPFVMQAQGGGLDPADILKPLAASWPTYNGDYSGKRYSLLDQVNRANVQHLTLAWMTEVTPGTGQHTGRRRERHRSNVPVIVGGEGPGDIELESGTI